MSLTGQQLADLTRPIINGHEYSFASIEFIVNGLTLVGASSINYWDRKKPGIIMNTAGQKVGRTPGVDDKGCECTMIRRNWDGLRESLTQSFGLHVFDITVMYREDGFPEIGIFPQTVMDRIVRARVIGVSPSNSAGAEPSLVKVAFDIMGIVWNAGGTGYVMDALGANKDNVRQGAPTFNVPLPGEM